MLTACKFLDCYFYNNTRFTLNYLELHSKLIDYANEYHDKESKIYRVVFNLAMEVMFKQKTNIIINTKELSKKLDVTCGYLRQIFYRLTDAGILDYSEGDNNGDKILFFNLEGVTRLIKKISLTFQNLLNSKQKLTNRPKKTPLRGIFWPKIARARRKYKPIDKDKYNLIDINTGEIKEMCRNAQANNTKRIIRTRFFQSADFRESYKRMVRV